MLEQLALATGHVLQIGPVLAILIGTVIGYAIGAMPGVGPLLTIALLIPFTYGMDPSTAIVGLITLYVAAEYGGAITAILLNTPGEAAAVATSWGGYPMARRGEAAKALHISMISSGIGALISAVLLIFTAVPLAELAVQFGPSEYFALALLGLTLAVGLGRASAARGVIAVGLGLLLSTVGVDPISGVPRCSPSTGLYDGIPLVAALTGLYALSEALLLAEEAHRPAQRPAPFGSLLHFPLGLYRGLMGTILRSSVIGFVVGVIPGAGAVIASLVAYNETVRTSPDPKSFGKGNPHGVAAAEAANNAAVLAGALMIQGIQPGPLLFAKHPEIPYAIFASLIISAPVMVLTGLVGARLWARVIEVPKPLLAAAITVTCLVGAYSTTNDVYPVYVTLAFGVIGWVLRKWGIPLGPVVLAFVLGDMLEINFRRGLMVAQGDLSIYLHRPITMVLLALVAVSLGLALARRRRAKAALAD